MLHNKNNDIYLLVARNIKKNRRLKGMTQKELANLSGYSYAYIRRLEGPKCIKNFSIQTVYELANAMDIDIKELFKE